MNFKCFNIYWCCDYWLHPFFNTRKLIDGTKVCIYLTDWPAQVHRILLQSSAWWHTKQKKRFKCRSCRCVNVVLSCPKSVKTEKCLQQRACSLCATCETKQMRRSVLDHQTKITSNNPTVRAQEFIHTFRPSGVRWNSYVKPPIHISEVHIYFTYAHCIILSLYPEMTDKNK